MSPRGPARFNGFGLFRNLARTEVKRSSPVLWPPVDLRVQMGIKCRVVPGSYSPGGNSRVSERGPSGVQVTQVPKQTKKRVPSLDPLVPGVGRDPEAEGAKKCTGKMPPQSTVVLALARLYFPCLMGAQLYGPYLIGAERSRKFFERDHYQKIYPPHAYKKGAHVERPRSTREKNYPSLIPSVD